MPAAPETVSKNNAWSLRVNAREVSGAFGDLGSDLPLLTGVALASGMDAGRIFLLFGLMQIASALLYGIPMPVQPLKAMAALIIVQGIQEPVIAGGALAIAAIMLLLTLTRAIDSLARLMPKPVIRGIQLGLGVNLALLALGKYVPAVGGSGILLAACCFVIVIALRKQRLVPASLVVLGAGMMYAFIQRVDIGAFQSFSLAFPTPSVPLPRNIWLGFALLALPQAPLSIGNAMFATKQLADDWFPASGVSLRRLGVSYSIFNLGAALFGAVPICHGSGGMAGHYAFGARTGGSVLIYGAFYVILGMMSAFGFTQIGALFPLPMLGVILFFEATTLMKRIQDVATVRASLLTALLVAFCAIALPYGFLMGMAVGCILSAAQRNLSLFLKPQMEAGKQ